MANPLQKVAENINDIEEFGDLPSQLLHRLSQILSKRRVLTPRTLNLFLRSDLESIDIYDCASTRALPMPYCATY
jgi:DNA repair protein RAD7